MTGGSEGSRRRAGVLQGGVSQAAGPASATVQDVNMKLGTRGRKSCSGPTVRNVGISWA